MTRQLIALISFLLLGISVSCTSEKPPPEKKVVDTPEPFIMGVDLSYVNQVLYTGGEYRDSGVIEDPYTIFSQYGADVVRLRLWNNPQWVRDLYEDQSMTLFSGYEDVKAAIAEVKERGMKVCLDFHYSDSWADPSKQVPPAAWNGLTLVNLRDSVYNYTLKTLSDLAAANLMPEYVQVGNEINPGFLLPQGSRFNNNGNDFIYLLNGAIDGVRDAAQLSLVKPKIIIHIAQPENVVSWFSSLNINNIHSFDIIGLSYYYMWSSVALSQVSNKVAEIKNMYGKDVMVVETGFPYTTGNADAYGNIIDIPRAQATGFEIAEDGQYNYLIALTQEIIDGGGIGIIYWEPAWISSQMITQWGSGSAWDCNTLFDLSGEVNKGMKFMSYNYTFN